MKPTIDLGLCKGCNICVYICPKKCYASGADLSPRGYFAPIMETPENCYNWKREGKLICELCVLSCPDQAIFWKPEEEEVKK